MKLFPSVVAMFLMVGSAAVFAANGSGPGVSNTGPAGPQTQPMEQNMFGQPGIAGDGIQNSTQVDDPSEIGREGATATDAPVPLPVEGDAGKQVGK
jgi:hypothetical protein